MDALTKTETSELAQHERTIKQGLSTFREVGAALMAIRDGKLYRDGHKTFEAYCQEKWGWDRRYANRLIEAKKTADNLGSVDPTPMSERQLRPLSKLPKEQRADAWAEASEDGQPTAARVAEVVAERIEQSPLAGACEELRDAVEYGTISEDVAEAFARSVTNPKVQRSVVLGALADPDDADETLRAHAEAKPMPAKEVIGRLAKTECLSLHKKYCGALKTVGLLEQFREQLAEIADAIKSL